MDMPEDSQDWPLVSALFITYKRFHLLEQAVRSFRENTSYPNLEIVIADDGSGAEIQEKIRSLPADVFAFLSEDLGLGANNNNGIRHCSGKYVLMIQDDWICQGPSNYLHEAVSIMEHNPQVGIINFAGAKHAPDFSLRLQGSDEPCYLTPTPSMSQDGKRELSLYSDQPHLQSIECIEFLGPYRELPGIRSETFYEQAWKNQTKYKTAVFPNWHEKVFQCIGDPKESFSAAAFRRRASVKLLPLAQWLKLNLEPVYKIARTGFYRLIDLLETMRIVE